MEKENLIIRLSTQIDTIKAHVNRLKRPGYKIHALDVDMLRQKTYEFYEHVTELETLVAEEPVRKDKPEPVIEKKLVEVVKEEIVPVAKEEIVSEEKLPVKKQEEPIQEEQEEEIAEVSLEINEPEKPTGQQVYDQPEKKSIPEPEPVTELKYQDEDINKPIIEESVENIQKEKEEPTTPKQTTYDLFNDNSNNVIAEKFQASEDQSIAGKMQKSHISNIREAIGINEKFLFINELFGGDLGRYNKIIDDINELPTRKGVETYLLELKIQFQWADDNEAFLKFKELLDRKFS